MTSFQPLWYPPADEDLQRGRAAVERAREIGAPTEREGAYVNAAGAYFTDPEPPRPDRPTDHEARLEAWLSAQLEVHEMYPEDVDAAAFYSLQQAIGAWILYEQEQVDQALTMIGAAADLEESMDKHPITPGEIYPVRELHGEMLLLEGRAEEALAAFQSSLERTPNRRNALIGARSAAEEAAAGVAALR